MLSCTMSPRVTVINAVDKTSLLLPASTPLPLLDLTHGAHHPQQLSPEHLDLPRWRLHGGYDVQGAATIQSKADFGLSSGKGSEVDRIDLSFASKEGNDDRCRRRCRVELAD
ncbi:hypothetical protein ZWY2020_023205 [Hordeum vulgare]|nr:hypothetical protein ZWY2020_023199 [Hordeum vulgare]KAI4982713.1 hypothetical protein ZWY2020_023205 [Hordeum vulgare]